MEEREEMEMIKAYMSTDKAIEEWHTRTGEYPEDMVGKPPEWWMMMFGEAVMMLADESEKVEKLRIRLGYEMEKQKVTKSLSL